MHEEKFYLFVPWHMAAMDFLSPSLIYCITFCYMFDFDHTDRDSSADLAAKHCTYTLTGLYKSEVFRNTGWLTTYRMIKAGRQIINSPLNHPALPLATGDLLFYSSPDISLCWTSSNPKTIHRRVYQQPASRTCEGRARSSPSARGEPCLCLVSHTTWSPWSCVATGTPRAAQGGWQSKPMPLGGKSSRSGLGQPQELPVKGAW